MANWCNVRLIVMGGRVDVLRFARVCRSRPSAIFEADMLQGEAQDLFSERAIGLGTNLLKKLYVFQVRGDDGFNHFRNISRQHPELRFVLVYGDPNCDDYGSYFLADGRARSYKISDCQKECVMAKHCGTGQHAPNSDEADLHFCEACWELMDLAEAHWNANFIRVIGP
jgi:hypothetical protein